MQCFYTFRGFLHKIYAATIDGKGRDCTHNFFSRRLGQLRAEHRAQGAAAAAGETHDWFLLVFPNTTTEVERRATLILEGL